MPATAIDALRVAVSKSPLSLPLYVAQDKDYFAMEGLDVTLTECIAGQRCLRDVFEGRADIATVTELPVVFSSFDRTDYAVVATFSSTSDDLKLVARRDAGITGPLELAGKRIGLVLGTSGQYFLDLFLLTVGVDSRGLSIVGLQPEEAVNALQSGKVDAIAIWEPYGYQRSRRLAATRWCYRALVGTPRHSTWSRTDDCSAAKTQPCQSSCGR